MAGATRRSSTILGIVRGLVALGAGVVFVADPAAAVDRGVRRGESTKEWR